MFVEFTSVRCERKAVVSVADGVGADDLRTGHQTLSAVVIELQNKILAGNGRVVLGPFVSPHRAAVVPSAVAHVPVTPSPPEFGRLPVRGLAVFRRPHLSLGGAGSGARTCRAARKGHRCCADCGSQCDVPSLHLYFSFAV